MNGKRGRESADPTSTHLSHGRALRPIIHSLGLICKSTFAAEQRINEIEFRVNDLQVIWSELDLIGAELVGYLDTWPPDPLMNEISIKLMKPVPKASSTLKLL